MCVCVLCSGGGSGVCVLGCVCVCVCVCACVRECVRECTRARVRVSVSFLSVAIAYFGSQGKLYSIILL